MSKAVTIARSLLEVPWVHQGRDPAVGIDCVGLLILSFEVPPEAETTTYGRDPENAMLRKRLEAHLKPVEGEMRVGDVLLLGWGKKQDSERHVAIVGDYLYGGFSVIHTDSIIGKVVEHPLDAKWVRRIREVYRHE